MKYKIEHTGEDFDPKKHLKKYEQGWFDPPPGRHGLQKWFDPPPGAHKEIKITPLDENGKPAGEAFYRCEITQTEIDAQIEANKEINLSCCYVENLNLTGKKLVGFNAENAFLDGNVSFGRTQFGDGNVTFRNAQFGEGNVSFSRAEFGEGNVSFWGAKFYKGEVSFFGVRFSKNVIFDYAQFGEGNVKFDFAQFGEGEISFYYVLFSKGNVSFRGAHFGKGNICFWKPDFGKGNVSFWEAHFGEDSALTIRGSKSPKANLSMEDVDFLGKLRITESELASLELLACTFPQPVNLLGCKFDAIDLLGTHFEKNVVLPVSQDVGKCGNRKTANTLKHQALIQNNRIAALAFYQQEMELYHHDLQKEKTELKEKAKSEHKPEITGFRGEAAWDAKWFYGKFMYWVNHPIVKNRQERGILFFDRVTNAHGVSWTLAMSWVLGGGFVFYLLFLLFCLCSGALVFSGALEGIGWFLGSYFIFITPLPRMDSFGMGNPGVGAYAIYYLSRLGLGVLYYQLIQAFRRNKRF